MTAAVYALAVRAMGHIEMLKTCAVRIVSPSEIELQPQTDIDPDLFQEAAAGRAADELRVGEHLKRSTAAHEHVAGGAAACENFVCVLIGPHEHALHAFETLELHAVCAMPIALGPV